MSVRPKKHLGQHFLTDESIAERIVAAFTGHREIKSVLEIGPGKGVLTKYLTQKPFSLKAIELDVESVEYLKKNSVLPEEQIMQADFLQIDLDNIFDGPYGIIGNMPYNISTQILFRVYDRHDEIPELIGLFQKEVAERIASPPGSKVYGILSVLLQAYYKCDVLFTVPPEVFNPPPAVQSAVLHLVRNDRTILPCDPILFKMVVKAGFNQRRKTLRNSLKSLMEGGISDHPLLAQRPEQLGVEQFFELTDLVGGFRKKL